MLASVQVTKKRLKYHDVAAKVYTIGQESQYVKISGVPALKLQPELLRLLEGYGEIEECVKVDNSPESPEFSETFRVKYSAVGMARYAKQKFSRRTFYGGNLRVSYAPEYETIQETKNKLRYRRVMVLKKLKESHSSEPSQAPQSTFSQNSTVSTGTPQFPHHRSALHVHTNQPISEAYARAHAVYSHGVSFNDVTSHVATSHGVSSHGDSSHDVSSHGVSSHGVSSHDVSSHGVSSHGVSSHDVSS
eukprot:Rmarinus@m.24298